MHVLQMEGWTFHLRQRAPQAYFGIRVTRADVRHDTILHFYFDILSGVEDAHREFS